MHFAILFEDDEAHAGERARHMAAHLDFLEAHAGQIRAAGPLAEAGAPAGGLWIVEAADEAAARALVEADPFWPTGLRRAVRILAWRRVFAEGRRQV
ncbi:hypothetical protein LNKW23_00740 [Paralimibaculum aggregatum]|uniref:YCII-related domain-containing protein n=1 Tax=Paralimibaculum aggregatum TaxID=3036245 RepID=A0ABQ6LCZ9_9RHOB|nr:YciI family protein [Limibaculum sp. NKW23]GMG80862.1 hypothetical protein LNKW23_00740 [Limibaculum sp. NKW23]